MIEKKFNKYNQNHKQNIFESFKTAMLQWFGYGFGPIAIWDLKINLWVRWLEFGWNWMWYNSM